LTFCQRLLLAETSRARREQIIAMGDRANDLEFMGEAGVSIAYQTKPVVREKRLTVLITWGWTGY